jgi:hypothetical protein
LEVRRSAFRGPDERQLYVFRSPYRCEGCGERFWVLSGNARLMIGAVVLLIALAALALYLPA